VTFDNLEELGKFLKQNPRLAEKVGYGGFNHHPLEVFPHGSDILLVY